MYPDPNTTYSKQPNPTPHSPCVEKRCSKQHRHQHIPNHTYHPNWKKARTTKAIHEEIFKTPPAAMTIPEIDTHIASTLAAKDTIPNHSPIKESIDKTMFPCTFALGHSTAPMLKAWATTGCSLNLGPNWTKKQIITALQHGPHRSALQNDAIMALCAETNKKVVNRYTRTVQWGDIKQNIPQKLKISPVAMVPHKSRKFCTILDLSFSICYKGGTIPSVNNSTIKQAPTESMVQLEQCLKRIVATLSQKYNPHHPFAFAKIDLKDGFWRMLVSNDNTWNFCYIMPSPKPLCTIDDTEIVVPSSLQMGWCESPSYFCAAMETARDVLYHLFEGAHPLPNHKLTGTILSNVEALHRLHTAAHVTNILEVFVDDFVVGRNNICRDHLQHFSDAIIHGIHSIFPPPWKYPNTPAKTQSPNANYNWEKGHGRRCVGDGGLPRLIVLFP